MTTNGKNSSHSIRYIGFTIGPILKTLQNARHTRELWAASYCFSYISREVIRAYKNACPKAQMIVPSFEGSMEGLLKGKPQLQEDQVDVRPPDLPVEGVGLVPDRFIAIAQDEKDFEALKTIVEEVMHYFGMSVAATIKSEQASRVSAYVKDYFQLYLIERILEKEENPIESIMPYLDYVELQRQFPAYSTLDLEHFFDRVTESFLVKDAWPNESKGWHSFLSIIEIACIEFKEYEAYQLISSRRQRNYSSSAKSKYEGLNNPQEDILEEEERLIQALTKGASEGKNNFKNAHKYVAIVQADGDNVGSILKSLSSIEFKVFSKKLGEFALKAVDLIQNAGGVTVYAGGDDLLFFAPVLNREMHIFKLLQQLDNCFRIQFQDYQQSPKPPSLSFGLSITYYKFPLYEALEYCQSGLFSKAKQVDGKNAISLHLQKHSGSYFGGVFRLSDASYAQFSDLLENSLTQPEKVLSSIIYKIRANEALFQLIGRDGVAVKNFIENSFDEQDHLSYKSYLADVANLIPTVFLESKNTEEAVNKIYALLRNIQFLTSTEIKD